MPVSPQKAISRSVNASLERLQTRLSTCSTCIEQPDIVPFEKTLLAVDDLIRANLRCVTSVCPTVRATTYSVEARVIAAQLR
jgi:aryl-alcohol dehydrogenase-like predicted oxidoreductase